MSYQWYLAACVLKVGFVEEPRGWRHYERARFLCSEQVISQYPFSKPTGFAITGGAHCQVFFYSCLSFSVRVTQRTPNDLAVRIVISLSPARCFWRSRTEFVEVLDEVLHCLLIGVPIERHLDKP
jgi:hypothetical protein